MITILNNLIFSLVTAPGEYITSYLISLAGLIIEELIVALMSPAGFVAFFSLIALLENLIIESIIGDIKKVKFIYKFFGHIKKYQPKYLFQIPIRQKNVEFSESIDIKANYI